MRFHVVFLVFVSALAASICLRCFHRVGRVYFSLLRQRKVTKRKAIPPCGRYRGSLRYSPNRAPAELANAQTGRRLNLDLAPLLGRIEGRV
jgi:hypothetical protein